MVTDPLFDRLFATSPETFFLLLGMPPEAAREMAARYEYQAIEDCVRPTSMREPQPKPAADEAAKKAASQAGEGWLLELLGLGAR